MYMRFVHLRVKEGRVRDLALFYKERVIPSLENAKGCLYASLLRPSGDDVECVSMTTWRSQKDAEAYEKSGLYDELLDASDDILAEATPGLVQSSSSASGSYPALQDPEIEAYPVEVAAMSEIVDADGPQQFFVRIVAARVEPGRFDELKERYDGEIKPALMATKGCRGVFLVENVRRRSRMLSVTIWDSEEDAIRYELSGSYAKLVAKISEFFSGYYQWKLSLEPGMDEDADTSKKLDVRGFRVVTGKRLGG